MYGYIPVQCIQVRYFCCTVERYIIVHVLHRPSLRLRDVDAREAVARPIQAGRVAGQRALQVVQRVHLRHARASRSRAQVGEITSV